MTLRLITPATAPAVTLIEARAHLRLDTTDEDTLVEALIVAATQAAEHETGRALLAQTWEAGFDSFPNVIQITRVPVQTITSISYTDLDGVLQTLAPGAYSLAQDDFGFARIVLAYSTNWPTTRLGTDSVKVRYVAGYASAAEVPQSIKSWMLLQVGSMYENREAETLMARVVPNKLGFVDALLSRYKVWS